MKKSDMEELKKLREQKKRNQNYRNQYAKENYRRIICMLPLDQSELFDEARGEEPISSYIIKLFRADARKKGLIN